MAALAGQTVRHRVEQLLAPMVNLGGVGIVLAWFMLRAEGKMAEQTESQERLRHAINRLAMAQLLEVATRPGLAAAVKVQAETLIDEIKADAPARA